MTRTCVVITHLGPTQKMGSRLKYVGGISNHLCRTVFRDFRMDWTKQIPIDLHLMNMELVETFRNPARGDQTIAIVNQKY